MYETFDHSKQRWGGCSEIIDYWLTLRQELLINYSNVAGLNKIDKRALPTETEFATFCLSLMDYVSAGHFRIYKKVMDKWKASGMKATKETDLLYFQIVETTKPLVEFNDKYSVDEFPENRFERFDEDISRVGEIMALRFELEDQLIQLIADTIKS